MRSDVSPNSTTLLSGHADQESFRDSTRNSHMEQELKQKSKRFRLLKSGIRKTEAVMKRKSVSSEKTGLRKSSRIDLATPVEVRAGTSRTIGLTENVSLGGLLLQCSPDFPSGGNIDVLFNLTAGLSIKARCSVAHVQPEARMGLRFLDLEASYQKMLDEFIDEIMLRIQQWQDEAIVKRLHVIVKGCQAGDSQEELGETLLLSRRGGVLLCRARFQPGDRIFLWSHDRNQGAHAKVVSHCLRGTGGLVELGFEFQDC